MSLFSHSSALSGASSHLRIDGISVSFADRRVLTDVSFVVSSGDRVGLIGENGSGKSTLLRVIAGLLEPTAGTVNINAPGSTRARIGLLRQEPPFGWKDTVADALESAIAPARQAAVAVSELGSAMAENPTDERIGDDYARALETAERLGAWDIDARITTTLAGFGLAEISLARPTGQLSGGQRGRLALAWLLLSTPDVLLLDEPTNHLDDSATDHLARMLTSWGGPVLMASHDRAFLDEVATSLIDLDPSPIPHSVANSLIDDGPGSGIGVISFTGTFSDYLTVRAEARKRWEQQYRDEQAEAQRLRATVKNQQTVGHADWKPRSDMRMAQKFYADRNAKVVSRRVNDARARLKELERHRIGKPPAELAFRGLTVAGSSLGNGPFEPVITAVNAGVERRLAPTSLNISRGEKWLLTGPNGAGKSTLLSLLSGRLAPTTGSVAHSGRDRVGLLAQETVIADPNKRGKARTAREAYVDLIGLERAQQTPLDTFGLIAGRDQNRPLEMLSVGQQRRLALAVLLADPPDILILDEPTNHFSLSLVTALEDALIDYPGTVVIASHDRWLRKGWKGMHMSLTP